jgi:hypothetical protein
METQNIASRREYTKLPVPLLTDLMIARSQGARLKELVPQMPRPNKHYLSGILRGRFRKNVPGPRTTESPRPLSRREQEVVLQHVIAATKGDITMSPEMQAIEACLPGARKRYVDLLERLRSKVDLAPNGHLIWSGGFAHKKHSDGSVTNTPRLMDGPAVQLSPIRLLWDLQHEVLLKSDQRLRPCRVFGRLCVNPAHARIFKGRVTKERPL